MMTKRRDRSLHILAAVEELDLSAFYAAWRRVLQTDRGKELYAKRQGMIEPVFAHTKLWVAGVRRHSLEAIHAPVNAAADRRRGRNLQNLHRP
jgi:hypothetical protein